MVKLIFYVPQSHLELVKHAIFLAGAGQQGNYDSCCWQILGQGQFRPLTGALECVDEYRVETVVDGQKIAEVVQALKNSHPYEQGLHIAHG